MNRFIVSLMLIVTWGVLIQALMRVDFLLPQTEWTVQRKLGWWIGQLVFPMSVVALYATATYIILVRL